MATPVIPPPVEIRYMPKLSLAKLSYAELSEKFKQIIIKSTALDAAVPAGAQVWAPNPDTDTLQAAKDNYDDAVATWNPEGPHGPATSLLDLTEARKSAEQIFMKYCDYVGSWARFSGPFILASGLELRKIKSPSGPTGVSTGLKQILTTGKKREPILGGFVGLKFKRGENAKAFNIYQVDKEGNHTLLRTGTRTRYIDLGGHYAKGEQVTVVVEGIGVNGASSMSAPITLTAL